MFTQSLFDAGRRCDRQQFSNHADMSREELERIIDEKTFSPFVLTTMDGFALAVNDPRKILLGLSMIIIAHADEGRLYQIPFRSIAHISEPGKQLG